MRTPLSLALALALSLFGPPVLAANDGPALTRVAYDDSRIPTLLCSTVYGCEIILQVGERLRNIRRQHATEKDGKETTKCL